MDAKDHDGVSVKTWKEKILGVDVHFYVLRLQQSFLLWVGSKPPQLDALSVAMTTRFVSSFNIICYKHL